MTHFMLNFYAVGTLSGQVYDKLIFPLPIQSDSIKNSVWVSRETKATDDYLAHYNQHRKAEYLDPEMQEVASKTGKNGFGTFPVIFIS